MIIGVNLFGTWTEINNDDYTIDGSHPVHFIEKMGADQSLSEHNNGFLELSDNVNNMKYYIHYTQFQFKLD